MFLPGQNLQAGCVLSLDPPDWRKCLYVKCLNSSAARWSYTPIRLRPRSCMDDLHVETLRTAHRAWLVVTSLPAAGREEVGTDHQEEKLRKPQEPVWVQRCWRSSSLWISSPSFDVSSETMALFFRVIFWSSSTHPGTKTQIQQNRNICPVCLTNTFRIRCLQTESGPVSVAASQYAEPVHRQKLWAIL